MPSKVLNITAQVYNPEIYTHINDGFTVASYHNLAWQNCHFSDVVYNWKTCLQDGCSSKNYSKVVYIVM